ncbi:MAG: tyrosine-type recombinase/integrase [Lachnospiraceae bacterium]|nr:tyrosine-type recombinase/integrase [Lachnospiraceae bacterium]
MAKRKKYPKLPNGYGQIRFLGTGRRNPYGVYPPATEEYPNGIYKSPKALCYVDDWLKGFAILTAYKAGTYIPGMEKDIELSNTKNADTFIQVLLANYNQMQGKNIEEKKETFEEVFLAYYKDKFKVDYGHSGKKTSMEQSMSAAFKNSKELHNKEFSSLTKTDLQTVIDNCPLRYSSLELILSLMHQMYRYAISENICDKDYSSFVTINKPDDDEHGVPFTESDLKILWQHKDDEIVEFILIMCYSGFRISAYKSLEINLKEKYFKGGVKTKSAKERIVPIHSAIFPLVKSRIGRINKLLPVSTVTFRTEMYKKLSELEIEKHTPHDCRHTFSFFCEKYGVNENDRKRMLGHTFSDVTNKVYGHRELKDLRKEIEKIPLL